MTTDYADPLLFELVLWCSRCRVKAHPREAAWLDPAEGVAVFEFAGLCVHAPVAAIVTASICDLVLPASRCAGMTLAGTWCRAWPRSGRRYCRAHCAQDAAQDTTRWPAGTSL